VKAGGSSIRLFRSRVHLFGMLACATAASCLVPSLASAQAMTQVRSVPVDCRDLKAPSTAGAMQSWQAFVRMEHCDRIKRLVRLSSNLPPNRQPQFFEGVVPADRLPGEFGVDVPVLRVVFPDHVFFDTAQSRLRPEANPLVEIIAESLRREPPDVALFVAGHADKRGDAKYNEALSIDRANALAEAIYEQGVAYSSIWRIGFGEDMPLVTGDDEAALDQNRRIEFLFASKPEAVGVWMADQQLSELCQARSRIEAERCKTRLVLKRNYEAVEIVRRLPTRVDPERGRKSGLTPNGGHRDAVAPSGTRLATVKPTAGGPVSVMPTGSRRIRIDPVLRRATPVRIDL
jgi:outer membrane protein OmpA-like peptidoglycan-associated protein